MNLAKQTLLLLPEKDWDVKLVPLSPTINAMSEMLSQLLLTMYVHKVSFLREIDVELTRSEKLPKKSAAHKEADLEIISARLS